LSFRDPRTKEEVTHILERGAPRTPGTGATYRLVDTRSLYHKSGGDDIQLVNYTNGESEADQDGNLQPESANHDAWSLLVRSDKINAQFDLGASKPLDFASGQPQVFNSALPGCWHKKHTTYLYYMNSILNQPWQKGDSINPYVKQLVGQARPGEDGWLAPPKGFFGGRVFTKDLALEVTISRCEEEAAPESVEEESRPTFVPDERTLEAILGDLPEFNKDPQRGIVRRKDQVQPSSLSGIIAKLSADVLTKAVKRQRQFKSDEKAPEAEPTTSPRRLTAIDRESATAAHRRVLKRVRGH